LAQAKRSNGLQIWLLGTLIWPRETDDTPCNDSEEVSVRTAAQ
jgi:hypothetical protein